MGSTTYILHIHVEDCDMASYQSSLSHCRPRRVSSCDFSKTSCDEHLQHSSFLLFRNRKKYSKHLYESSLTVTQGVWIGWCETSISRWQNYRLLQSSQYHTGCGAQANITTVTCMLSNYFDCRLQWSWIRTPIRVFIAVISQFTFSFYFGHDVEMLIWLVSEKCSL